MQYTAFHLTASSLLTALDAWEVLTSYSDISRITLRILAFNNYNFKRSSEHVQGSTENTFKIMILVINTAILVASKLETLFSADAQFVCLQIEFDVDFVSRF